jgi:hypothetical protein
MLSKQGCQPIKIFFKDMDIPKFSTKLGQLVARLKTNQPPCLTANSENRIECPTAHRIVMPEASCDAVLEYLTSVDLIGQVVELGKCPGYRGTITLWTVSEVERSVISGMRMCHLINRKAPLTFTTKLEDDGKQLVCLIPGLTNNDVFGSISNEHGISNPDKFVSMCNTMYHEYIKRGGDPTLGGRITESKKAKGSVDSHRSDSGKQSGMPGQGSGRAIAPPLTIRGSGGPNGFD